MHFGLDRPEVRDFGGRLPVALAVERETNPFLRCERENVRVAASQHAGTPLAAGAQTFAALRAWKDAL